MKADKELFAGNLTEIKDYFELESMPVPGWNNIDGNATLISRDERVEGFSWKVEIYIGRKVLEIRNKWLAEVLEVQNKRLAGSGIK